MSGIEFKQLLKNKGITQNEAAKMLGVSRSAIQNWLGLEQISPRVENLINQKLINSKINVIGNLNTISSENCNDLTAFREMIIVLQEQIKLLKTQLKEKDVQIKEKDAQIKILLER